MPFIILVLVLVVLALWLISLYNRMVSLRNNRESSFADIDVQLKQRSDLIPQLVETVKGYSFHEKDTLEKIIQARNGLTTANSIGEKIQADNQLTSAIQGLRVQVEAYPDLKANQNFLQLQDELSDIENKLAAARRYFNAATKEYNNSVEMFPANLIAGSFGFSREKMYDLGVDQRAKLEDTPKVNFNQQ